MDICPFCKINSEKTRIIKDIKNVFVVLSNPRLQKGHLLIIPKRHVEKIADLYKEEIEDILKTIIEFQEKITQKISTGCDLRQNYRPFLKDSKLKVSHLHFHLIPREFKDKLYQKSQIFEKDIFAELGEGEAQEIINKLK